MTASARHWWAKLRARRAPRSAPAPVSACPPAALEQLAGVSEQALASARADVAQLRAIVNDAVRGLGASFDALNRDVQSQSDVLTRALTSRSHVEAGHEAELPRFIAETRSVLGQLVAQALALSENGRAVAARMNELAQRLARVEEVGRSANRLADRTTLVALNAKIEAAHAGAQGESFMVVANEVRELATEARGFNSEVARLVDDAIGEARGAATEIVERAERDCAAVVAAREQVDALLLRVARLDESMARSVNEYAGSIGENVAVAVRCLQFEDIASQVAGHALRTLETLSSAMRELHERAPAESSEQALARIAALADRLAADARKSVTQKNMTEGEVELF